MTRDTSSTASSSSTTPPRPMLPCADGADERGAMGDAYTLGNDGAVADVGLEPPVSRSEVSGDSGRESREDVSLMRVSDIVRSSDCARFVSERGFEYESFSFASSSESEPRLSASSACRARLDKPVPWR